MKPLSLIALTWYNIHLDNWILQVIIAETKPTNINHTQQSIPHIISYFMTDICCIDIKRTNDNINWLGIKLAFRWFIVKKKKKLWPNEFIIKINKEFFVQVSHWRCDSYRNTTVDVCLNFCFFSCYQEDSLFTILILLHFTFTMNGPSVVF